MPPAARAASIRSFVRSTTYQALRPIDWASSLSCQETDGGVTSSPSSSRMRASRP